MNLSRNISGLVAVAVIAALTSGAFAAASINTIVNNSSVLPTLDGTNIVRAYNLGHSIANLNGAGAGETEAFDGITYKNIETTNNHTTSANTVDLSSYAGDVGGVQITTTTTSGDFGNFPFGGTSGTNNLWATFIYANASDQALEISGLDNSKDYKVQVLFGEDRTNSFAAWDYNVILDDVDSGQNVAFNSATNNTDMFGLVVVDVTGQSAFKFGIDGGGPGISGVIVSEVAASGIPTPAALPAGLALIGLVAARRRRRC